MDKQVWDINFGGNRKRPIYETAQCPQGCPVDPWLPKIDPNCMCGKPLMIYIPPGQHIHPCKVHPYVVIRGSRIVC